MTPEERFNHEVWWLLQEIRKEELTELKGEKVLFSIRIPIKESEKTDGGIPSADTQRRLLYKLKEWGAIDLRQELTELLTEMANNVNRNNVDDFIANNFSWGPTQLPKPSKPPTKYVLTIHQPKFDELYRKYENLNPQNQKRDGKYEAGIQPSPVEIVGEVRIRGFEEKVVLQKPKNKKIQLRKFPSGLRWEETSIQFLDEHEVIIKARKETSTSTFEAMGFQDEKRKLPNKQWQFLKGLSETGGELSWRNPRATAKGKKQKQLLAETLKAYFQIDEDPFFPYKQEKSYKIRINLIPEGKPKSNLREGEVTEDEDSLGFKEFYKEEAPIIPET